MDSRRINKLIPKIIDKKIKNTFDFQTFKLLLNRNMIIPSKRIPIKDYSDIESNYTIGKIKDNILNGTYKFTPFSVVCINGVYHVISLNHILTLYAIKSITAKNIKEYNLVKLFPLIELFVLNTKII